MEFLNTDMLTVIAAFAVLILSGGFLAYNAFTRLRQDQDLKRRLEGGNSFAETLKAEIDAENKINVFEKLGSHLSLPDSDEITKVRFELSMAGYYSPGAVKIFYALRLLSIIIPLALFVIYLQFFAGDMSTTKLIMLSSIVAAVGLLGPGFFIKMRRSKRKDMCRDGFPDMMDLLVACIEAGLGIDAAFIRVTKEIGNRYPPLKINLELMNLELRAGRSRQEALATFAQRIDLEEARSMSVLVKQAEEMGSSLGATLRQFSSDMREKRMLKAEEKAAALSAKLTVPMMLFIFPVLITVVLVPAGIRLAQALA